MLHQTKRKSRTVLFVSGAVLAVTLLGGLQAGAGALREAPRTAAVLSPETGPDREIQCCIAGSPCTTTLESECGKSTRNVRPPGILDSDTQLRVTRDARRFEEGASPAPWEMAYADLVVWWLDHPKVTHVVKGTVLAAEPFLAGGGRSDIWTRCTIAVEETFRGANSGKLEFETYGGEVDGLRVGAVDAPQCEVGTTAVFVMAQVEDRLRAGGNATISTPLPLEPLDLPGNGELAYATLRRHAFGGQQ